ncbi:MAG: hypothetical protein ABJM06_05380 [Gilvibacter sp.]
MRTPVILIVVLTTILLSSCKSAIEVYENSPHKISASEARKLFINYHTRFNEPIKEMQKGYVERKGDSYFPTEYVWVSLEDLRCYIKMLDEVAAKNKPISGVAIYLGAYGADKAIPLETQSGRLVKRSGDYKGRITNFMAPTYDDMKSYPVGEELNKHKPFVIIPSDAANPYIGTYVPIDFSYTPVPSASRTIVPDTTGLFFNELNAMPPKKPNN